MTFPVAPSLDQTTVTEPGPTQDSIYVVEDPSVVLVEDSMDYVNDYVNMDNSLTAALVPIVRPTAFPIPPQPEPWPEHSAAWDARSEAQEDPPTDPWSSFGQAEKPRHANHG